MHSARLNLDSTSSTVSSSSDASEEEIPRELATSAPSKVETSVTVNKVVMKEDSKVPGVHVGPLVNNHLNFFLNPSSDVLPGQVDDLVTDAVKINQKTIDSYISGYETTKLTGPKEVERLSRRWCYLITALVTLSLITLLGTAVLSLTSWRTVRGTGQDPATQAVLSSLASEEKKFSVLVGGPSIVTRSMWLAAPPTEPLDKNSLPAILVVVCHSATETCVSQPSCIDTVGAIQRFHQKSRKWADIGYNFLIGGDGEVYWGRGFEYMGAHTKGFNNGSVAVAFVGMFTDKVPSEAQKEAFQKLVRIGVQEGKISPDYMLVAQCQLKATAAPGLALARDMASWPHYNSSLPVGCTTA